MFHLEANQCSYFFQDSRGPTVYRGGGGPGGVLWYFHAYVGSDHFWGVKILNFNIFWGFQKNKYFFGCEDFVNIFLGSSQNWTIFRGHFFEF